MKRCFALLFLVTVAIWAQKPLVSREVMATVENSFDQRIIRFSADEPFDLLGTTRGIYLEGYGVVLTMEVNLLISPGITPFHPAYTAEEKAKVRQKKLLRLPALKQMMMDQLFSAASMLDMVPANEQIVLGVQLLYRSWEDSSGLPRQILMQAPRSALKTNQRAAVRVQELY